MFEFDYFIPTTNMITLQPTNHNSNGGEVKIPYSPFNGNFSDYIKDGGQDFYTTEFDARTPKVPNLVRVYKDQNGDIIIRSRNQIDTSNSQECAFLDIVYRDNAPFNKTEGSFGIGSLIDVIESANRLKRHFEFEFADYDGVCSTEDILHSYVLNSSPDSDSDIVIIARVNSPTNYCDKLFICTLKNKTTDKAGV